MKDNFVTSLELSKELKELGCKQESEFYWVEYNYKMGGKIETAQELIQSEKIEEYKYDEYKNNHKFYSAYLSDELLEMLPEVCWGGKAFDDSKPKTKYVVNYDGDEWKQTSADTLPDALALMLIYLLKNKVIGGKNEL